MKLHIFYCHYNITGTDYRGRPHWFDYEKCFINLLNTIKDKNVNVLDLWDATSNLAQSTTNSDALKYVDLLIRSNIEKGLNQQNPTTMTTETPDESESNKKKDKKNKKNKDK
jgi:hypothetical protein